MKMNVHLNFNGNCAEAFGFYKQIFHPEKSFLMKYADGPPGMPIEDNWKDKILHASMPLGSGLLMGCDAPPGRSTPMGGFQVSVEMADGAEVKRIYDTLAEGGSVQMPLAPTFWSPLFGMCTDKFGTAWMVGVPGEEPA